MGQITSSLTERQAGALPAQTEKNPNAQARVMAISTRSSWTTDEIVTPVPYSKSRVISSWEEEFSDELRKVPSVVEREFDPESDLAELEALLYDKPTVEVQQVIHHEFERGEIEGSCWHGETEDMPSNYSTANGA